MSSTSKGRVTQGAPPVKRSIPGVIAHWILMGCSLWMSVEFFHRLGQGTGVYILGAMAVGFELTRREAWRVAVQERSGWMGLLATVLTVFAILAASSYVLDQVEGTKAVQLLSKSPGSQLEKEIGELDQEILRLGVLQAALDPVYRTSVLEYSKRQGELRDERRGLEKKLNNLPAPDVQVGNSLGGNWGVFSKIPNFPFWFWLGAIGAMELGIIATIPRSPTPKSNPWWSRVQGGIRWDRGGRVVGQSVPVWDAGGAEVGQNPSHSGTGVGRTLEAAFVDQGEPLRGRRELTALLGVPERVIRRDLERIQGLGLVLNLPGKGLVLNVSLEEALIRLEGEKLEW